MFTLNSIIEMFAYGFMQRAYIAGMVISIPCALLGVFLVLRRFSLLGDGIAHISFGGIAFGLLFDVIPFVSALIFSLLGAVSILKLKERSMLYGDTAIGIISHASLGIGIFIVSIASGYNISIISYLFGSILAVRVWEVYISIFIALAVIILITVYYMDLFYVTFDEESALASGINIRLINYFIVILTAFTVVCAMKVAGLLLASALIIFPASSSLQLKLSFKRTLIFSCLIGVVTVFFGIFLSYFFSFEPSGSIVILNLIIFFVIDFV